jgi:thioredoxin 1
MTVQLNAQSTSVVPSQGRFQISSEKMIKTMKATQEMALKILDFATSPLAAYFLLSNLALSYGANISFLRSTALSVLTPMIALPTTVAYWSLKLNLLGKTEAPVEKTTCEIVSPLLHISRENFQREVIKSKVPVVLDAFASWNPPSQKVAPIFAELSREMEGKIKFVEFDVETNASLKNELKIEAAPSLLFFKDGKIIDRQVGELPKEGILLKCMKHFLPKA